MVVAMIKSKKDHEAINFIRQDLHKYNLITDFVIYSHFPNNELRFQVAEYKNCFEKHITT